MTAQEQAHDIAMGILTEVQIATDAGLGKFLRDEFIKQSEIPITAALEAKDRRIERLEGYLERAGWRRCDIPACNCNGYHNWNPTREEIEEPLRDQLTAKDAEITALMEKGVAKDFEIHSKDAEIERLKFELLDGDRFERLKSQLAEARRLLEPFATFWADPPKWRHDLGLEMVDHCRLAAAFLQNSEAAK